MNAVAAHSLISTGLPVELRRDRRSTLEAPMTAIPPRLEGGAIVVLERDDQEIVLVHADRHEVLVRLERTPRGAGWPTSRHQYLMGLDGGAPFVWRVGHWIPHGYEVETVNAAWD